MQENEMTKNQNLKSYLLKRENTEKKQAGQGQIRKHSSRRERHREGGWR